MPNARVSEKSKIPAVPTIFISSSLAGLFVLFVLSFLPSPKKCITKRTGIRELANEIHCQILSSAFLFAKEGLVMLQIREDRRINPMISIKAPAAFNQRLFSARRNIRLTAYKMPAPTDRNNRGR